MVKSTVMKQITPFIVLVLGLIAVICVLVWKNLATSFPTDLVKSVKGEWDLNNVDFSKKNIQISGEVAYIPNALLTPNEYAQRADEEVLIYYSIPEEYGTSRLRIYLPKNEWYTFTRLSIDYAEKVYVNGTLLQEVGKPGTTEETNIPNTARIVFTARPINGCVEIVQQSSNFVHKQGGYHGNWYVGREPMFIDTAASDLTVSMEMGIFLALFLVHMILFILLREYWLNFYFSCFCLVWFLRIGMTGPKLFSFFLPWLSWYAKFRIEYLSLPIALCLMILLMFDLFPNIFHRYFKYSAFIISAICVVIFLFAPTREMSRVMLLFQGYCVLAVIYMVGSLALRLRNVYSEQTIFLIGSVILFYAAIRDILFYNGYYYLPPFESIEILPVALVAYSSFAAVTVMLSTVRKIEMARIRESQLLAENESLERVNQLRSDMMNTISHETRTPLAVLASYAGLVSMELKEKGANPQTTEDLDKIAYEAKRVAELMESMKNFSGQEEEIVYQEIHYDELVRQTAQLYDPILRRQEIDLIIDIQEEVPTIIGNPETLSQVLFNVLQNAKNYTHEGAVEIIVRSQDDKLITTIKDTGIGISEDFLPYIFQRGVSGSEKGSGLGLSICKEIVEEHNGVITVESKLDEGTIVQIILPIKGEVNSDGE